MKDHGAGAGADEPRRGAQARELDLFDLIAFVWVKKLLAALVALALFLPLAFVAFVMIKPSYEATGRLLVILDPTDLTPGAAGSGGAFTIDQVMQSETEILNSDAVRRRALDAEGRPSGPAAVRAVREGFKVERAPNASVLTMRYEAKDAEAAAATLNALIDAYLAYRIELLVGGEEGGLDQRLAAAEAEAARAEEALRRFLNANGVSDFETERSAVLARLSDLEARRVSAEAEAAGARAFAAALQARLREIPQETTLYVENAASGQLLDLETRRAALLSRYLPDAPPVQAVEREIAAMRAFLDAGGAEGRGQTRTGVNPIHQALDQERLQQDAFATSQERLAAALQIQIRTARAEADRLRALAPEHDRLTRAVTARAESARLLSAEAADASARRNAPPGAADAVRVVERPTPPSQPQSLRNAAIAAVFVLAAGAGVFVALLAGYLDHRALQNSRPDGPRPDGPRSDGPAPRRSPEPSGQSAAQRPSKRREPLPVLARVGDLEAPR
ncbi:MAG: Wzz/FepE/Etk N-terminal domain-containing protein [Oceanicaulis sp.]